MPTSIKSITLPAESVLLIIFVLIILLASPLIALGAIDYVPLTQIPGVTENAGNNPAGFFNGLVRITIVISAFLAIIMIMVGGIEYMTSEAPGAKADGKERITNAIGGLLLILLSVLLLNIINPDIVKLNLFN